MMDLKRVVGLTGGMGAGKSTIAAMLRSHGTEVLDVDQLMSGLYEDEGFAQEISQAFDLDPEENIKAQVKQRITDQLEAVDLLDEICKPWIDGRILEETTRILQDHPFVVLDTPLLYEAQWNDLCDHVVLVLASRAVREQRVMARQSMTRELMLLLMARQLDPLDLPRIEAARWIFNTDDTLEHTEERVKALVEDLRRLYA